VGDFVLFLHLDTVQLWELCTGFCRPQGFLSRIAMCRQASAAKEMAAWRPMPMGLLGWGYVEIVGEKRVGKEREYRKRRR
jgi:hypothetical protein